MFDKLKRRLRERKVFIPLIIFFIVLAVSGVWWIIAAQGFTNPEKIVDESDKRIAEEIARNFKREITVEEFKRLINDQKIEKVYHQYSEKEYQSVVKYYIKLRGEDGYYISKATPGTGYIVMTNLGFTILPLNDYLNQGAGLFYNDIIEFKVLTTEPKMPVDRTQYLIMGIFLVVFVVILIFLFRWQFRGGGGFTKAQLQEAKKAVYFADVGGVDEALEESREVVGMIKSQGDRKNGKK